MVLIINLAFRPETIAAATFALFAFHANMTTNHLVLRLARNLANMVVRTSITDPFSAFKTERVGLIWPNPFTAFLANRSLLGACEITSMLVRDIFRESILATL